MAKIVGGAALIAGAAALTVLTGGVGAVALIAESGEVGALFGAEIGGAALAGASLLTSGIADALHLNDTGQQAFASHQAYKPWQIVYGRQRVSGNAVDISISDGGAGDNRWLWIVEALAAHPIQDILATYLNQQQVFCDTSRGLSGTNGLTGNLIGSVAASAGNMDVNGMALEIHPFDLNFREYDNFYFDGNPRFWMAQYNGLQTEADPFYMALCEQASGSGGPHWTSSCVLEGIAYSLNRYWANSNWATGAPQCRYDMHGKNNIYDPRTSTYGYTENAALVLADYMCNQQYGMLYSYSDFDADTLIAAANICDETVALSNSQIIFNTVNSTEARYAINGTLSTATGGGTIIEQMLGAMAGRISYIGGKWFIFPGVYQGTSGVALTQTDLVGGIKWTPNRKSRDLFNEVRALFVCPSGWDTTLASGFDVYNVTAETVEDYFNGQWMRVDMPPFCMNALRDYGSDPYLTEDSNVKYIQQIDLPFTISVACAQRLSKILLLRNRWQGTGTLTLPIQYLTLQPNDILTLTYARFGWSNKQLEVQSTHINLGSVDSDGSYTAPSMTVTVAEVDASIYAWLATDELKLQGGQGVSGAGPLIVPAPTNLTCTSGSAWAQATAQAGSIVPVLHVSWTLPADASVSSGGKIYIQLAPVGSTQFTTVNVVDGNTTSYNILGLNNNTEYQVQLFASNTVGIYSQTTAPVTVTVTTGTPAIPPMLTGLEVTASLQTTASGIQVPLINLSWEGASDLAVTANGFVQVWAQESGFANTLIASVPGGSNSYTYTGADAGYTYSISLIAVDVWGNQSPATAQVAVTVPATGGIGTGSTIATSIENATTALANAAAAQTAAAAAESTLATITGTSVLTPGQKASIIADYNALIAAQSANDTQAALVGVSHTAYDSALSTLTTYLGTLTSPVAWNVTTNYTTINGTTFANDFEAAYAAENALLNAIANAINTLANTGVENAATALSNAAAAQTAANAAESTLATITGTSVLTPGQKASIIADYNALIAAQSANDTQAVLVGVSHTAYDTALSTLTTYLGTLTSPVAWNVTTNYTTINGTTFANDFEAAYAAENALLTAIANAINATANTGVENAATALSNAAAAQAAANAAQTTLNTITGTSILTPGQKAPIIADYNALIAAQAANDTQATLLGVPHSTYDTALSALTTYLGTLTSPVAWSNTSGTTTINGTTFANTFEAAYAAENALLNAIASYINSVASSANGAVILQNPNFAAGNVGWTYGTGWLFDTGVGPLNTANRAKFYAATATTSGMTNAQRVPCSAGTVLSAACSIINSGTIGGSLSILITFVNASGVVLGDGILGNAISADVSGWTQSRVVATAPTNAAYAAVSAYAVGASGFWWVGGFSASILANSLNDIPDGPTRYAAVETGADRTLNHVLTTVDSTGTWPTFTAAELTDAGLAWDVTANDPSDVFNISAIGTFTSFTGAPGVTAATSLNLVAVVDGVVSSQFGIGLGPTQSVYSAACVVFFGSKTGLTVGAHTIRLYYSNGGSGTTSNYVVMKSMFGEIQQISS